MTLHNKKNCTATSKFNDISLYNVLFFLLTLVIGIENCEFTFFQLMSYACNNDIGI